MGSLVEDNSKVAVPCHTGFCNGSVDAVLHHLGRYGPEYGHGFSNHAPMVVEALEYMGRPELGLPWVTANESAFEFSTAGETSTLVLGDGNHLGWANHFEELLTAGDVEDVVAVSLRTLSGGVAGGAGHGLLRTWHALRGWRRHPGLVRRDELARGLGYWASSYLQAPAAQPSGSATLLDVLADVAPQRGTQGTITAQLASLDGERVAQICALAGIDSNPAVAAAQLIEAAAVVLRHGPGSTALLHALTVSDAVNHLIRCCDTATAERMITQTWGLLVSLYTLYGLPHVERAGVPPAAWDELIDAACTSGDPHQVKLVAAGVSAADTVDDRVLRAAVTEMIRPHR